MPYPLMPSYIRQIISSIGTRHYDILDEIRHERLILHLNLQINYVKKYNYFENKSFINMACWKDVWYLMTGGFVISTIRTMLSRVFLHVCVVKIAHHCLRLFFCNVKHFKRIYICSSKMSRSLVTKANLKDWKLRPAYSPETPNLGKKTWCLVPCDLEIWWLTLENNRASLLCCFKLCATFHSHWWIQTGVTVWKRPIWVKFHDF